MTIFTLDMARVVIYLSLHMHISRCRGLDAGRHAAQLANMYVSSMDLDSQLVVI